MSNLLAAAFAREMILSNVKVDVTGHLSDEGPARFVAINLSVSGDSSAPDEFAGLVAIAGQGCLVANTLRASVELSVLTGP
jgi:uncharacterized OsmC-like protein